MNAYFNAHRSYFVASSSSGQAGAASDREKEMLARFVPIKTCAQRNKQCILVYSVV